MKPLLSEWIKSNSNLKFFNIAVVDLNGVLRGKKIPLSNFNKIEDGKIRMPFSVQNLDIWGQDIEGSKWVFETGDGDGKCLWTGRLPLILEWQKDKTALVPVYIANEQNVAFSADPRNSLKSILKKFESIGLKPSIGIEIEFYFFKNENLKNETSLDAYSITEMDSYSEIFLEINKICEKQKINIESSISECGAGQFELSLKNDEDIIKIADNIVYLKYLIKGIAKKHNLLASFMPKPFTNFNGSGLHSHISILGKDSKNIFDNNTNEGSENLLYAVNGLLSSMRETALIMAPNLNSFRRIVPESHAPHLITWGYENRTVALRIPGGENSAKRIEHRVAGPDINPYLYLTTILAGCFEGISSKTLPIEPVAGNAYITNNETLPGSWQEAIHIFSKSDFVKKYFSEDLIKMYLDCKKQELRILGSKVTSDEIDTYLKLI
mgnify:FL=1